MLNVLVIRSQSGNEYTLYPELQQIPEGTIEEGSVCTFHMSGQSIDPFAVALEVDGLLLDRIALSIDHVCWKWQIGFHAGLVEIAVTGLTRGIHRLELITDPHKAKLTRREYGIMIADILTDSLALAGIAGSSTGIARGAIPSPQIARIEFLRHCLERIESAILELSRNPSVLLETEIVRKRLSQCGALKPMEFAKSARYAQRMSATQLGGLTDAGRRLAAGLNGSLPTVVPVSTRRVTHVRKEHSDILSILNLWQFFLQRVLEKLRRMNNSDVYDSQLATVVRRCNEMLDRIRRLKRLPLFDGIASTRGPIGFSQLFRRSPHYRSVYQAYRDFLSGLANIEGEFLNVPLRRTFELYETWCFLRLAHAAIHKSGGSDREFRDVFEEKEDQTGLRFSIVGKPMQIGVVRFLFKPRYREIWKVNGPTVGSFTRMMEPDIAVETRLGEPEVLAPTIVLDAKYRVETQLNDAIVSLHTYRDALVRRLGEDSAGQTVKAAFVLSPSLPIDDSISDDWRDANSAVVFFRPEYKQRYKFGAVVLKPGMTLMDCREILKAILGTVGFA